MIFPQPYFQCWKHVNYNQIPTFYVNFITHLILVEILTLNKCNHWDLTVDLLGYYVRLKYVCNVKMWHQVTFRNQRWVFGICYVVPFCKFHSFITSIQGEVFCWFLNNSTNFACWESMGCKPLEPHYVFNYVFFIKNSHTGYLLPSCAVLINKHQPCCLTIAGRMGFYYICKSYGSKM